jgi:hypothetical protein
MYAKKVLVNINKELDTNILFTFLKCIIIKYAMDTALKTNIKPNITDKK